MATVQHRRRRIARPAGRAGRIAGQVNAGGVSTAQGDAGFPTRCAKRCARSELDQSSHSEPHDGCTDSSAVGAERAPLPPATPFSPLQPRNLHGQKRARPRSRHLGRESVSHPTARLRPGSGTLHPCRRSIARARSERSKPWRCPVRSLRSKPARILGCGLAARLGRGSAPNLHGAPTPNRAASDLARYGSVRSCVCPDDDSACRSLQERSSAGCEPGQYWVLPPEGVPAPRALSQ